MKLISLFIFLFSLGSLGFSQTSNSLKKIKSMTYYSFKDTTGINLNDSTAILPYIQNKKTYNRSGKLTQEIKYPFPHNPTYKTTKITNYIYKGDTTITNVFSGGFQKVSEEIYYPIEDKKWYKKMTVFGDLQTSRYVTLDQKNIFTVVQDSIEGVTYRTYLKDFGSHYDTIRIDQIKMMSKAYRDSVSMLQSKFSSTKIDTVDYGNLMIYGYQFDFPDTTAETLVFQKEIKLKQNKKLTERLSINESGTRIRKNEVLWQDDKPKRKEEYTLVNDEWELGVRAFYTYNQLGDLIFQVRETYRRGKFAYSYSTLFRFEYYD